MKRLFSNMPSPVFTPKYRHLTLSYVINNEESDATVLFVTNSRQALIPADVLLNYEVHLYFGISLIIRYFNSVSNGFIITN